MTGPADRIEALIRARIEQNRFARGDALRLAGVRFKSLHLAGSGTPVGLDYQRKKWSLAELLAFYDRQFIQHAYLVLLKRDADVDGLNARLDMLRSGQISRVELLFRLRYGPEGKQHGTVVTGLLRAIAIERLCQLPVIGIIPRYLRALGHLPRMQQDIEQLRGLIAMQGNDLEDKCQAIVDFQNEHLIKILRQMNH